MKSGYVLFLDDPFYDVFSTRLPTGRKATLVSAASMKRSATSSVKAYNIYI